MAVYAYIRPLRQQNMNTPLAARHSPTKQVFRVYTSVSDNHDQSRPNVKLKPKETLKFSHPPNKFVFLHRNS